MSIHICEACGKPLAPEATTCPYCGADQHEDIRLTKVPETIEELQAFCAAHKMPLDAMRFFIGEDFKGARAFGVFKREDGTCVVYKNKSDGSRAIRYEGPDEKHAVREIYEKIKSETDLRRGVSAASAPARDAGEPVDDGEPMKAWQIVAGGLLVFWKPVVIVLAAVLILRWIGSTPDRGYYRYQDDTYYYQNHGWYFYNALSNDWEQTRDVPMALEEDYDDYYQSETYDSRYALSDFTDSSYYEEDSDFFSDLFDSDSTYDDYDWDSGGDSWSSWDSSDTDWDSDW